MLIKICVTPPPGLPPHSPGTTQSGVPVDDNLFEVSEVGGYDSFKRDCGVYSVTVDPTYRVDVECEVVLERPVQT